MNPTVALIPSAYKSGLVYSILPASGRGDFQFNRPSSATRVNKDGLVEEMPSDFLGSEIIQNGSFSSPSSWFFGNTGGSFGWNITGGTAICNAVGVANGRNLQQTLSTSLIAGNTYRFSLDILQSADSMQVYLGGSLQFSLPTGTNLGYSIDFIPTITSTALSIFGGTSDLQEIDNVSIKPLESDVPRLDYTNVNCPQLLLEPQSSNLVTYSQDLTDSDWYKFSNGTTPLVENDFISPSGEANAQRITFYSGADGIVTNNATVSTSSNYSISIYMKGVKGGEQIRLDFKNNASQGNIGTTFTLTNQWVRYTVENLTPLQTSQGIQIRCTNPSEDVQLYAWGGQIENLTYATSYIPTEATTVTRSRDLMTDSMAGRPEITSDDWTLFLDFNKSDLGSDNCVSINDGTNDNSIVINNRADDELAFILNQGGSILSSYDYDMTGIDDLKVCFSSTNTGASMVVNGVEIDRLDDGRFDASSLTQIDFTVYGTTNAFAGRVNDFRYYNVALSLNETIKLTQ